MMYTTTVRTGLLSVLLLLLSWLPAHASHLVGGELSYRYLGRLGPAAAPFRYELTARIYLKAQTSLGQTGHFQVLSRDPASGPAVLADETISYVSSVLLEPNAVAGCVTPPAAAELRIFRLLVDLPEVPQGYLATYDATARTAGITNIASSAGQAMYLSAEMTPPTLPNASPTFSATILDLICLGDTTSILNNAVDADGDRLSYRLVAPTIAEAQAVTYAPGYSFANPFGTTGYISLDAQTGLARYMSQRQGLFVVAIEVEEYRMVNGREVRLGKMRRDMQITVRQCSFSSNQAPQFTPAVLATKRYTLGEGQALAVTLGATDPDQNPLTLQVQSELLDGPGGIDASFGGDVGAVSQYSRVGVATVRGTGAAAGTFRLAAGCGMARAAPYDLVLVARDEVCNSKTVLEVVSITVTSQTPPALRVRGDSLLCDGAEATYAVVSPTLGQYQWQVAGGQLMGAATGPTVRVRWQATTAAHTVAVRGVLASGCPTPPATHPVVVVPGPQLQGPELYCRTDNAGLRYSIAAAGAAGYQWVITNGSIVAGQGTASVVVDVAPGATAQLQATAASGQCRTSALTIRPDNSCLYFYNVITPNADGRNDQFEIENLARHPRTALTVFNRWGSRVYESADYQNDFGTTAAAGLYYYLCQLADGRVYKGWFEVLR